MGRLSELTGGSALRADFPGMSILRIDLPGTHTAMAGRPQTKPGQAATAEYLGDLMPSVGKDPSNEKHIGSEIAPKTRVLNPAPTIHREPARPRTDLSNGDQRTLTSRSSTPQIGTPHTPTPENPVHVRNRSIYRA